MRRGSFRDHAVVARTYDFGEADRVIVLVTQHHGVVRAVAKGVRRAHSRFGSRLQPFVHLDVLLYPGKNLATIAQADTVAFYASGVIDDWDKYAAASVIVDAAERLSTNGGGGEALFLATVNALKAMQVTDFPAATLDSFLLNLMRVEGVEPSLFDCAVCRQPGPHRAFSPHMGGAVCGECRTSTSSTVDPSVLRLMWLLLNQRFETAAELLNSEEGAQFGAVAHRLTSAQLQWHMDSAFPTLKFMNEH